VLAGLSDQATLTGHPAAACSSPGRGGRTHPRQQSGMPSRLWALKPRQPRSTTGTTAHRSSSPNARPPTSTWTTNPVETVHRPRPQRRVRPCLPDLSRPAEASAFATRSHRKQPVSIEPPRLLARTLARAALIDHDIGRPAGDNHRRARRDRPLIPIDRGRPRPSPLRDHDGSPQSQDFFELANSILPISSCAHVRPVDGPVPKWATVASPAAPGGTVLQIRTSARARGTSAARWQPSACSGASVLGHLLLRRAPRPPIASALPRLAGPRQRTACLERAVPRIAPTIRRAAIRAGRVGPDTGCLHEGW
jgi:hypothetical protein